MRTITMALALCTITALQAESLHYPNTRKDATVDEYFGVQVADPYRWLENDTSRETLEWVEAENRVTQAYLSQIPFRAKMLKRLTELSDFERVSAPAYHHGKWYFFKNNGRQNQSVYYVMDELGGEARVFLDPNTLSSEGTVALSGLYFSHNGKYLTYAISRNGSDWLEFFVIDLETGLQTDDHVEWAKVTGAAWLGDGFYYSAYDRPTEGKEYSFVNEGHKIYYHKIGTPQSEDQLFYFNPTKPKAFFQLDVSKDENLMYLIESGAGAGNILYVRDLRIPDSRFIQLTDNMDYQYSPVYNEGDKLYLYTNDNAPMGCLKVVDLKNPGMAHWQTLIPEQNKMLDGVQVIDHQLILTYSQDACHHAYVYTLDGQLRHEVKLPMVGSLDFTGDAKRKECFYTFSSFTQPGTVYRYDIDKNEYSLYYQPKVQFKPQDYVSEQVFFTSKDGTRVPMFITYKKMSGKRKARPLLLYGYGGFNVPLNPYFSPMRIPFLEEGGIYVQANLRGGSEYGEEWHLAGTKMNKQNVFDDFIAAAEYLIQEGYTTKDQLAIMGGSNGGLLVGACMTQRPDLFRVVIAQVGVMDMLRYHLFTIGWNWAPDYGTSADSKEMFEYLKGYSPLHNLKKGVAYPATLVTTADHDDRVVPAHSFKFAATLQECHEGANPVLIRIDTNAGHGGGKPLAKRLEEQADIYSFILYNIKK